MILLFKLIVILSILLFLHSYLFYPLHLWILYSQLRKTKQDLYPENTSELIVSCIVSVYNEAGIIERKIRSLLESDFPAKQINIFVGSDSSSDNSNIIIEKLSLEDNRIHFFNFKQRRGKTLVINDLVDEAFNHNPQSQNHILLFTDANVILTKDVIKKLCTHFSDKDLALIDSKIIPTNLKPEGISFSENQYMSLEIKIKHMEGEVWGAMMGAFGGCFAIRSSYFEKVPSRFLVDDFYISMCALEKGGKCKNELDAVCYEGMPDQLSEEFRRKSRISAGNFQNLAVFYKLLFHKPWHVAYAFFSHKVLRWMGPLLILLILISFVGLSIVDSKTYLVYLVSITMILVFIPILDYLMEKIGIHIKLIRGTRYFIMMNIALLFGFINYVSGIRKSSWEPPKRSII